MVYKQYLWNNNNNNNNNDVQYYYNASVWCVLQQRSAVSYVSPCVASTDII